VTATAAFVGRLHARRRSAAPDRTRPPRPAEHGIEQLDDLGVLQVPPLAALGSPAEIAARFGSTRELKHAVTKLSDLIYVA
jgi:hypothetical protein